MFKYLKNKNIFVRTCVYVFIKIMDIIVIPNIEHDCGTSGAFCESRNDKKNSDDSFVKPKTLPISLES